MWGPHKTDRLRRKKDAIGPTKANKAQATRWSNFPCAFARTVVRLLLLLLLLLYHRSVDVAAPAEWTILLIRLSETGRGCTGNCLFCPTKGQRSTPRASAMQWNNKEKVGTRSSPVENYHLCEVALAAGIPRA